jgi:hypothetical protein
MLGVLDMPGNAGINGNGSLEETWAALFQMVKCMSDGPFYTSGTYVTERMGFWV